MGYRSEVTIAIPKGLVKGFEEATSSINDIHSCEEWWDRKVEDISDSYTYYELNSWKFYGSYKDVDLIVNFCKVHNEQQKLLKVGEYTAILRVGDEDGDIEDYFDNAYECGMGTKTNIVYV